MQQRGQGGGAAAGVAAIRRPVGGGGLHGAARDVGQHGLGGAPILLRRIQPGQVQRDGGDVQLRIRQQPGGGDGGARLVTHPFGTMRPSRRPPKRWTWKCGTSCPASAPMLERMR